MLVLKFLGKYFRKLGSHFVNINFLRKDFQVYKDFDLNPVYRFLFYG